MSGTNCVEGKSGSQHEFRILLKDFSFDEEIHVVSTPSTRFFPLVLD